MANGVYLAFYVALLVYSSSLAICSCGFTTLTTQRVWKQFRGSSVRVTQQSSQSRPRKSSISESRRNRLTHTNLTFVEVSTICFTLLLLTLVVYSSLILRRLMRDPDSHPKDRIHWKEVHLVAYFVDFFQISGYISLSLVMLVRYDLTFSLTKYQFSHGTKRLLYACLILAVMLIVLMISVAVEIGDNGLRLLLLILAGLLYTVPLLWINYRFVKSTSQIAMNIVSNSNSSKDIREHRRVDQLLEVSLKLTVVSSSAVLTTLMLYGSTILRIGFRNESAFVLLNAVVYPTDALVNCWSILCVFSEHSPFYYLFCSDLHSWLNDHVLNYFD